MVWGNSRLLGNGAGHDTSNERMRRFNLTPKLHFKDSSISSRASAIASKSAFTRSPRHLLPNRQMASIMQEANRLKRAMEQGPSMGVWQMIPGANVSRTLARTGVDWVLVDCEHGNIDGDMLFSFIYGSVV